MTSREARWRGVAPAELSWVRGCPQSTRFDDLYFSREGGLDESRHVFLASNQLPERWQTCGKPSFTIAETGFGTGLNFLATWQAWRQVARPRPRLHFISVEGFPLLRDDLARALDGWPQLFDVAASLLAAYPPPLPGRQRVLFEGGEVCLDLVIADIDKALDSLLEIPDLEVDAWFLDGFAPARNPAMWTAKLFRSMAMLGAQGSTFATFTAAGDVRRGLTEAGFNVEKAAGYGNKRELLHGTLAAPGTRDPASATPWHLPKSRYPGAGLGDLKSSDCGPRTAMVVGAGLAGSSSAWALARRGWKVQVFDRGRTAGEASGNSQGVIYTRLSHRPSPLNDFSLLSFGFASRLYRSLLDSGLLTPGVDGELCGTLQLRPDWDDRDALFDTVISLPDLVNALTSEQATALSGLSGCPGGLFFPGSGWMNPPSVCRALLDHPQISVREGCGELHLTRDDGDCWTLANSRGDAIGTAPVVIVACGSASAAVAGADWLRLQPIRGQTSQLPSTGPLAGLKTVVCHEGYLPPAREGEHCMGATFDISDSETATRAADHKVNIDQLCRALPQLADTVHSMALEDIDGRVGFRCASPDYLPIVGAVPALPGFCEDYADLRRNARKLIPDGGRYVPGLYLSTGHGSRGLTSTPLSGELLAAQISGEPWPLDTPLARALSPARFPVRDLIRNRL